MPNISLQLKNRYKNCGKPSASFELLRPFPAASNNTDVQSYR